MNKITKVVIGLGIVGVTAAVAGFVAKKKTEKKYATLNRDVSVENDSDDDFMEQIKAGAQKKAIRILAFVVIHKERIETVAAVISLVGAIFGVVNAVNDFNRGKELHRKLDNIFHKLGAIHLDLGMLHEVHECLIAA